MEFTSDVTAVLTSYYGSDRMIAERAWCSTGKGVNRTAGDVIRLIKFLVRKKHTKPLEMIHFSFAINIPIFLDRQLTTHRFRDGDSDIAADMEASIAESHRYQSADDNVVYFPEDLPVFPGCDYKIITEQSFIFYIGLQQNLISAGLTPTRAREIARNVLPVGTMIHREFTINLLSLSNFMDLRLSKHAQLEMQMLATHMLNAIIAGCPDLKYIITELVEIDFRI